MRFSEFYSGWRSWSYALKDIADSVQAARWKDVHHEAARFCDIAEGLKRFAGKLEHDKGEALMTRLERSVALMASLDEVSAQDGVGANAMVQQVQLVQATIPSLVPSCWLSFASTQHGVHRPSCR